MRVVSDTAEAILLDTGAVEYRLPELDEGYDNEVLLLPYASVEDVSEPDEDKGEVEIDPVVELPYTDVIRCQIHYQLHNAMLFMCSPLLELARVVVEV